jgi:hypothetical protein
MHQTLTERCRADQGSCRCRFHHRLKTFTAWTYRMIAPGVFEWTSPHGHQYLRDRTGTRRLDDHAEPPERP